MSVTVVAEIDLCVDCVMLAANGEVFDGDGNDISAAHAVKMGEQWPAGHVVVASCDEECEGSFSWSRCEGCGSTLGGERHPGAVLARS